MVNTSRKSVLAVIHAPGWGGLHTLVERIGPTCGAMGYDWTIVIPRESDPKAVERLRATGLDVIQIPLRRIRKSKSLAVQLRFLLSVPVDVFRLSRIIRRRRIDIVQPAGLIHFHSAVAARLAGVPVVWQLHSDQPPMMLRRIFVPWVVRLASAVMTSGSGLVAAHPGLEKIADRIYPFRAPIDTDRFHPDPAARTAARAALQVQPDDIVVGTVGGWGPNKNHGLLVQAVALARQTEPRLKLRILGFPYDQHLRWYAENVEEPARRLGPGVVAFLQPGQRVDHFMNGFDIFCLPSRGEGASLVVGEAMGTGLPVIANAVGALPDSVLDGQTGLLNRSLTAEEMARHILALAADPDRRQAMGAAGRAFCIEKMSYAACARAHIDAYEAAARNFAAARRR